MQKLALRLKAAGRPYLRQKPKKPDAQGTTGPSSNSKTATSGARSSGSAGRGVSASGVTAGRVDSGERPSHVVQVIIVPIFWLKREEEMRDVIAAAHLVEKLLSGAGVDCGVDTTVPMAPGQKFKHWEVAGVKVRVEVGPKEAEQRSCILAVCSKPGEVADKSTVQVGQELLDAVRRQLPQLPPSKAVDDRALLASLSIQRGSGRPGGNGPRVISGRGLSIDAAAKSASRKVLGGDDLEDDFLLEADDNEKAQKTSAQPEEDVSRNGTEGERKLTVSTSKSTSKKKGRTVVF